MKLVRINASIYEHDDFYKNNTRINLLLKKNFSNKIPNDSKLAVDLGCGAGTNSHYLQLLGYKILAIDMSLRAKEAAWNFYKLNIIIQDVRKFSIKNTSKVEILLLNYVVQHLTEAESCTLLTQLLGNKNINNIFFSFFYNRGFNFEMAKALIDSFGWNIKDMYEWERLDLDHGEPHVHSGVDLFVAS